MANELQLSAPFASGSTVYALRRNVAGQVWNGTAFENYLTANYAAYPITMTQQGTASGYFVGTDPALTVAGSIVFKVRSTADPAAETDPDAGLGFSPVDANVVSIQSTPLASIKTQLSDLLQAPWSTWEATASPLSIAALIPAAFIWSLSAHAGELTTYKTGGSVEFHQYPLSSGPVSSGITQISG